MAADRLADREAEALAFLRPDETAGQFLARSYVRPFFTGVGFLDDRLSLRPASVVEVAGLAGVGKTELLLNVAATCLLPQAAGGVAYGGHGAGVLFLDLDCKFDVLRLMQILQGKAVRALQAAGLSSHDPTQERVARAVSDSMDRLVLVRCASSFDLLAALRVARPAAAALAARCGGLGAVLVDSVTAHYYSDKGARGAAPGGGQGAARDGAPLTLHRVHAAMAAGLKQIQQAHRVPIVATKHILVAGGKEADVWAPRDVMMKPWQDVVTHRLVLARRGGGGAGRMARWTKPYLAHVDAFSVNRDGIFMDKI